MPELPEVETTRRGTASDLALFGVIALAVLAMVEYLVGRGRSAARSPPPSSKRTAP